MSQAAIENARVKKEITESFFYLLSKKNFSEITVTDIIKQAGVARASYYRNFDSKEQIIEQYIDSFRQHTFLGTNYEAESEIYNEQNVLNGFQRAFTLCLANKSYLLSLYDNGFSSMIQDLLNDYIVDLAGFMKFDSIEIYKLYFISGATSNMLREWLKRGAIESPREMAQLAVTYLKGGFIS